MFSFSTNPSAVVTSQLRIQCTLCNVDSTWQWSHVGIVGVYWALQHWCNLAQRWMQCLLYCCAVYSAWFVSIQVWVAGDENGSFDASHHPDGCLHPRHQGYHLCFCDNTHGFGDQWLAMNHILRRKPNFREICQTWTSAQIIRPGLFSFQPIPS